MTFSLLLDLPQCNNCCPTSLVGTFCSLADAHEEKTVSKIVSIGLCYVKLDFRRRSGRRQAPLQGCGDTDAVCTALLAGRISRTRLWVLLEFEVDAPGFKVVVHPLHRETHAARETDESVLRWRKSWFAAAGVECMSNAIDGARRGLLKMHSCSRVNITDSPLLSFYHRQATQQGCCAAPKFYLRSKLYNVDVNDNFSNHIAVRQHILCSCTRAMSCSGWCSRLTVCNSS